MALDTLDEIIAAVHGNVGHELTDDEMQEPGVYPDVARSQPEELPDVFA